MFYITNYQVLGRGGWFCNKDHQILENKTILWDLAKFTRIMDVSKEVGLDTQTKSEF